MENVIPILTVAALAGLVGGAVFSALVPIFGRAGVTARPFERTPDPETMAIMGGKARVVRTSTSTGRAVEGRVPRPGFVPFLELPLDVGPWIVIADMTVTLRTWSEGPFFDSDGGLGCQLQIGETRINGRFQIIQQWAADGIYSTRGTVSLHAIVDAPLNGTVARLAWEMLPTQPMSGSVEPGSSITAIPIEGYERFPELPPPPRDPYEGLAPDERR
jgi:hypothetical protein